MPKSNINPLLWEARIGKYALVPFDKIKFEHFQPAFEQGLKEARETLKKVSENPEEPTFENTIEVNIGETLDNVSNIFFNLLNVISNDKFQALAQEIAPQLAEFGHEVIMNEKLFARVKKVYNQSDKLDLTNEQKRLLETSYKTFVRNGALLDEDSKGKIKEIDMELSQLSPQYMQNVLNATNAFELHIKDEKKLAGIPENSKKAAEFLAKQHGKEDGWYFNLQAPSIQPILGYADDRELRKKISTAYLSKAFNDEYDNQELIKKIVKLRHARANILGYKTHAAYILEERMAENPQNVRKFLDDLIKFTMPFARKELDEIKQFALESDGIKELMSYDSNYYSNKIKKHKFDFDEEKTKVYFKMENVISGVFLVANKLYGLEFSQLDDVPVYQKDVTVYEVTDENKNHIGILYVDLFPRKTKRGGAWMTSYLTQGKHHGKMYSPQVSIVGNLTPSTDEMPSLLKMSEVTTLFHEFGHALHGLLSDCTYTSLASPNVYWDFVELPSQIMENWAFEKEALDLFAFHYQTGEKIPAEYIEKIKKVQNFQAGLNMIRQLSYANLDMGWHNVDPSKIENVSEYENKVLANTQMLPIETGKNISCSFGHIFTGGYSAGYYSYKWAEVLEADAFELFKEKGIFDKDTATSFRKNVLAKGNTEPPMDIYVQFRGRKPDPNALLRKTGLK